MAKDIADQKIKCFTEEVLKIEKAQIEVVCVDQCAHSTIEEALHDAFGDKITCGHFDCEKLKEHI